MYCPRCAAENGDEVRYCRACGVDLASVAAIMRGEPASSEHLVRSADLQEVVTKRAEATRRVTSGAILLLIPLLTGPIFGSIVADPFLGLILWVAFFGWMLIPGGFSLANGLGDLLASRVLLKAGSTAPAALPRPKSSRLVGPGSYDAGSEAPPSVTEHTTRKLDTNGLAE